MRKSVPVPGLKQNDGSYIERSTFMDERLTHSAERKRKKIDRDREEPTFLSTVNKSTTRIHETTHAVIAQQTHKQRTSKSFELAILGVTAGVLLAVFWSLRVLAILSDAQVGGVMLQWALGLVFDAIIRVVFSLSLA
jgi:hypothetical protein